MRIELRPLLHGLAKLAAIVLAAGLGGTLVGIGLAKLSGNDGGGTSAAPVAAATTAQTTTTAASPPAGAQRLPAQPSTIADPAPAAAGDFDALRVDVLSARLTLASPTSDRSSVVAQVRVTNPGGRSVALDPPMLVSEGNAFRLDADGGADAGSLLGTLAAGASATGLLRFTPSSKVTRRLVADPNAQLRIAGRTVALKLTAQLR